MRKAKLDTTENTKLSQGPSHTKVRAGIVLPSRPVRNPKSDTIEDTKLSQGISHPGVRGGNSAPKQTGEESQTRHNRQFQAQTGTES